LGCINEPPVEVGFAQQTLNAREGLMLFGPVRFERNPKEIRVGVIGSNDGIDLFKRWCVQFRKPVTLTEQQHKNHEVPFPGFEAVFGATWPSANIPSVAVSRTDRGCAQHRPIS
jgi:hypothetical protein